MYNTMLMTKLKTHLYTMDLNSTNNGAYTYIYELVGNKHQHSNFIIPN